jgi:hypothetical protein
MIFGGVDFFYAADQRFYVNESPTPTDQRNPRSLLSRDFQMVLVLREWCLIAASRFRLPPVKPQTKNSLAGLDYQNNQPCTSDF